MSFKYLNTCACVEAMNNITSRVFIRLSYEYGICFLKREMIPTLGSICMKTVISNIGSLREKDEIAAYINLYDLITLGLVELNFEETEKATNILPDFRVGKRGCDIMKMSYEKYNSKQVPIDKYNGRVLNAKSNDVSSSTWSNLLQIMNDSIYANMGFQIDDHRIVTVFLETFIEEMFYELAKHKGEKNYSYKLYDLLYFNTTDDPELWGTDVMPEYKLMVKNDAYLEDNIYASLEESNEGNNDNNKKPLYYDYE